MEKRPPSLCSMSRRNKLKLFCLVLGAAESSLCLSLLAPFYPGEVEYHVDVMPWKHVPLYWPFVMGIQLYRVTSPYSGPVIRGSMFPSMLLTESVTSDAMMLVWRQLNCWLLRCSWNIACRRCSNYIFILHLTPGFTILRKDNCMSRRGTFKFWYLVRSY